MLLGPVFTSEMVTTARRTRYFLIRILFAGGLLLLLWSCCLGVRNGRAIGEALTLSESAEMATSFFGVFSWLTLTATVLVVPALAAGSIATERDRRTIEYLFATDLSNAEIVLSKLAAKVLLVAKLLLVALPVLAIFRLLGGIPGDLLLAYFLILASTALLLVMLSLFVSVWSSRARDALTRVYLLLVTVLVLPWFVWIWLGGLSGVTGWGSPTTTGLITDLCGALIDINPFWVYGSSTGGGGALGVSLDMPQVWAMVGWHSLLSVVMGAVAVLVVRRVHLGAAGRGGSKRRESVFEQLRFRPRLGSHPMLWKELFARTAGTRLGWIGRIAMALIMITSVGIALTVYFTILWYFFQNRYQSLAEQYAGCTAGMMGFYGTGFLLLVAIRAAGLVSYEKERDCWLSLIATPLVGRDIVLAKVAGNIYAFRWLLLPLVVSWLLQLTLDITYLLPLLANIAVLLVTTLFVSTVGLFFSLKLNTTLKSIGASLGLLIFVGGGYLFCCCVPFMIGGGDDDIMEVAVSACIPFLLCVPTIMFIETNELDWMIPAFTIGMLLYSFASVILLAIMTTSFDELVGRTTQSEAARLRPTT